MSHLLLHSDDKFRFLALHVQSNLVRARSQGVGWPCADFQVSEVQHRRLKGGANQQRIAGKLDGLTDDGDNVF